MKKDAISEQTNDKMDTECTLHDCVKPWVQECVSAWMDDSWVAEWPRDWEKTGGSLSAGGLQEQRGKRVRNEQKMKSWLWLHVWMVDWLAGYKFPKPNLRQATSTLSYLFSDPPRRWATASLGHLFSQLLLLWGAYYLANVFSDPLLLWAAAPKLLPFPHPFTMRLWTSSPAAVPQSTRVTACPKTFGYSPAEQERLSMTKAFSYARQCCCILSHPVGVPQSTVVWRWSGCFTDFVFRPAELSLQSRAHSSDLIFKSGPCSEKHVFWTRPSYRYVSCTFFHSFSKWRPETVEIQTLAWPRSHNACKDTMMCALPFFRTQMRSCCDLLFALTSVWSTWWCADWPWTFVRNPEVCWKNFRYFMLLIIFRLISFSDTKSYAKRPAKRAT